MASAQPRAARFEWDSAEGQFSDCSITWPQGTPDETLGRLTTAGSLEPPGLAAGRWGGVHVYHRDADAQRVFRLRHPNGLAQYAVFLRSGQWEDEPFCVEALPNLLRLLLESHPIVTLFAW